MIVIAVGIVGATVMPHNLYLHSALVQSRQLQGDESGIQRSIRFNTIDTVLALSVAFLVNAAILVLAAMVFFGKSEVILPDGTRVPFNNDTDWIIAAYRDARTLLGNPRQACFLPWRCWRAGQSSTITGTLAGQVVMEGFMHWRMRPWLQADDHAVARRSLPAVLIIWLRPKARSTDLLVLSQVVLAMQLPFAMFPLLHFASSRRWMGEHRIGWFLLIAGWISAILITALDIYGLPGAAGSVGRHHGHVIGRIRHSNSTPRLRPWAQKSLRVEEGGEVPVLPL